MKSLDSEFVFINKEDPSNLGIIQLAKYLRRIDHVFFNWIENLPDRKGGIIQSLLFPLMVAALLVKGARIVWVMHNKISHKSSRLFRKKIIFFLMSRVSHLIITHSFEGVSFLEAMNPQTKGRAVFLHHPVVVKRCPEPTIKKYDILIWGTMQPYKGILEFVRFWVESPRAQGLKVLIVGKFIDEHYYRSVSRYRTDNIEIVDAFIDDQKVLEYACQSRYVLFPYFGETVLSSGALMDSVGMLANIIGPRVGAFLDLAEIGIISLFSCYQDIVDIVRDSADHPKRREDLLAFARDNSWDRFAQRITPYL